MPCRLRWSGPRRALEVEHAEGLKAGIAVVLRENGEVAAGLNGVAPKVYRTFLDKFRLKRERNGFDGRRPCTRITPFWSATIQISGCGSGYGLAGAVEVPKGLLSAEEIFLARLSGPLCVRRVLLKEAFIRKLRLAYVVLRPGYSFCR